MSRLLHHTKFRKSIPFWVVAALYLLVLNLVSEKSFAQERKNNFFLEAVAQANNNDGLTYVPSIGLAQGRHGMVVGVLIGEGVGFSAEYRFRPIARKHFSAYLFSQKRYYQYDAGPHFLHAFGIHPGIGTNLHIGRHVRLFQQTGGGITFYNPKERTAGVADFLVKIGVAYDL